MKIPQASLGKFLDQKVKYKDFSIPIITVILIPNTDIQIYRYTDIMGDIATQTSLIISNFRSAN